MIRPKRKVRKTRRDARWYNPFTWHLLFISDDIYEDYPHEYEADYPIHAGIDTDGVEDVMESAPEFDIPVDDDDGVVTQEGIVFNDYAEELPEVGDDEILTQEGIEKRSNEDADNYSVFEPEIPKMPTYETPPTPTFDTPDVPDSSFDSGDSGDCGCDID